MAGGSPIARLFVRLGMDKSEYDRGARDVRAGNRELVGSMGGATGAAGALTGALKTLGAAGLAYAAKEAVTAAFDLGRLGAQALRTEASFDRLAGRIGETGDSLLQSMRAASQGTVSDMVLMQTTSGLLASGIQASSEDISAALQIAMMKAQQFGLTTEEAYQRMVDGSRKGSVEMLDELGIVIKAESAYKRRAEALGVTVDKLSDAERAESLWMAVLEDGRQEIEQHGGAIEDYATSFEEFDTVMADLVVELKQELTPAMAGFADAIIVAVREGKKLGQLKEDWQELIDLIEWLINPTGQLEGMIVDEVVSPSQLTQAEEMSRVTSELAEAQRLFNQAVEFGSTQQIQYYAGMLSAARDAYETMGMSADGAEEAAQTVEGLVFQTEGAVRAAQRHQEAKAAEANATDTALITHENYTRALEESEQAAAEAAASVGQLTGSFQTGKPAALLFAEGLYAVNNALDEVKRGMAEVSLEEIGQGFEQGVSQVEGRLLGLAGVVDQDKLTAIYGQYSAELEALYRDTTGMTDFELAYRKEVILQHLEDEVDGFRQAGQQEKDILSDMNSTYNELRSVVQQALTPTGVTALDMALSESGQYVDKWDENARRLDAIAQRGFAELDAHPDWAEMLKIPPDVLAAGEQALKDWAGRMAGSVRSLERPDLLNIDAAVAAVQAELDRQAAVELSLDLVTQAAVEAGVVGGEDAKSNVAQLLGIEEKPVQVPVELMLGGGGDEMGGVGGSVGAELVNTLVMQIQATSFSATLSDHLKGDVKEQKAALKAAGVAIWDATTVGIMYAMHNTPYVEHFAELVSPYVARYLENAGTWSGSGEE